MASFSDFRISTRLHFGFGILVLMTVMVGIIGIKSAHELAEITSAFHDSPFKVVDNIGKARVAFRTMRMASRDLILAQTPQEMAGQSAESLLVAAAKAGPETRPIRFVQVGAISGGDIPCPAPYCGHRPSN
jgi:hypothetical protein